jgi:lysozyme
MNITQSVALLSAGAVLLLLSASESQGAIEAGEGGVPTLSFDNAAGRIETVFNVLTEEQAMDVPHDTAERNTAAYLAMLRGAEGTDKAADPWRVCYGYRHTLLSYDDHPAITGEWRGEVLPPSMCKNAGFGPGCKSTAAGAYQIIKPTWVRLKSKLGLPDFSPASQDAAAIELIAARGALEDVKAGRFSDAVHKCRHEWASLPGNYAKQGQRSIETLALWYENNGGEFA